MTILSWATKTKSSKTYLFLFYGIIIFIYIFYYGGRNQVDFTAFYRASDLFLKGYNPYDRNYPFYFLNAPSALYFIGPLALFDLNIASILFRLVNFILLVLLIKKINSDTKIPVEVILSVVLLSTPYRSTFGSGMGGIFIAIGTWYLVSPLIFHKKSKLGVKEAMFALLILSFKPYLIFGIVILYLSLKQFKTLFLGLVIFIIANMILSINQPLYLYWIENMRVRSNGLFKEEGASSIVSIVNRFSELFINLEGSAWVFYITLNLLLVYKVFSAKNIALKTSYSLCLTLALGLYINHRDFVALPLVVLICISKKFKVKNIEAIQLLSRCGLLLTSALFQFFSSFFEPNKRYSFIKIAVISTPSFLSGLFWDRNLEYSFLIYDFTIQLTLFYVVYSLIKIEGLTRLGNSNNGKEGNSKWKNIFT